MKTEIFIKRSKEKHGDKYDYSRSVWISKMTKIEIICPVHGSFFQLACGHLSGRGCRKCGYESRRDNTKSFIEESIRVHGLKYNYDKTKYINARTKVVINCSIHGDFAQKPSKHILGQGCDLCGSNSSIEKRRKTKERFVEQAKMVHGERYDYSKVNYTTTMKKVEIICKIHGSFWQKACDHIGSEAGCPCCLRKNHSDLAILLKDEFSDWNIIPNKKIWNSFGKYKSRRFCDFWMEKDGIEVIVEYDGQQHYREVRFGGMSEDKAKEMLKRQKHIDRLDKVFCKENGIILHRVKYNHDKISSLNKLKRKIEKWKKELSVGLKNGLFTQLTA